MAFATSTTFNRFCQNTVPSRSVAITAGAFGPLAALGQVPLTGIVGTFSKYSVLNNGVLVASNQTASSYTITGLGNNVQIGPVTVVPYNAQGRAGTAFTVTGGSGAGKIYTWAQANTPTFSATTSSGTTLACSGTFSKAYVSFSGGTGSPASGTLINTANSITQVYTGMVGSTLYSFNVYPVNGDGIPASATGTNVTTGSITTLIPVLPTLWVSGGQGGNVLAYSTNGIKWTGLGDYIFILITNDFAYSAKQKCWGGIGYGYGEVGNTLGYSSNGITWTGLGASIFPGGGKAITYSSKQDRWIAGGDGYILTTQQFLAYSNNGITWTGLGGASVFGSPVTCIAYSANQDRWVAGAFGTSNGNTLAYSSNGITWIGSGKTIFTSGAYGVAYSTKQDRWVAIGYGTNCLAYSSDGITWIGLGSSYFSNFGQHVAYSENQDRWVATGSGGTGTGNSLAYSSDGITWIGLGVSIFSYSGRRVAYSMNQDRWVATGASGTANTLAYSSNGITWTGLGTSIYSSQGFGLSVDN